MLHAHEVAIDRARQVEKTGDELPNDVATQFQHRARPTCLDKLARVMYKRPRRLMEVEDGDAGEVPSDDPRDS